MPDRPATGALAILASTAMIAGLLVAGAPAQARYHRAGPYLDYGKRPSLLHGFGNGLATYKIAKGGRGVAEIYPDGRRWFSAITDAQYGLWNFTRYLKTGRRSRLVQAERAARWIKAKQDPRTGIYPVNYSYDLGPRSDGTNNLTLIPPWYGANVQAYPLSLLSRLYRETGRRGYLRHAKLALRPLAVKREVGGVQAPFFDTGDVFFEGYATLPIPVHTLSHHVQTLVALYDMSDLSPRAARLFAEGMRTLHDALPSYDLPAQGRSAAWLAHLTDPPRPVAILSGWFQEALVTELRALNSVHPDPVVRRYAAIWGAELHAICMDSAEACFFTH